MLTLENRIAKFPLHQIEAEMDYEENRDADPQPVDMAKVFYSGVFAGFIYGAFAVLVWKWFR